LPLPTNNRIADDFYYRIGKLTIPCISITRLPKASDLFWYYKQKVPLPKARQFLFNKKSKIETDFFTYFRRIAQAHPKSVPMTQYLSLRIALWYQQVEYVYKAGGFIINKL
jgi:hypothetical protein